MRTRSLWRSQAAAQSYDKELHTIRRGASLGTFRVTLDNIRLPELSKADEHNVKRLQNLFHRQGGPLKLDPAHHITATIDDATWQTVSSRARVDQEGDFLPPQLPLGIDEWLVCVHGKCRIQAANLVLQAPNRWWVVDLYRLETAEKYIDYRKDRYHNEKAAPGGVLYHNILDCQRQGNINKEANYWGELSSKKSTYLRQFLNSHPLLAQRFKDCSSWPALWQHILVGDFHKIQSAKCEAEQSYYIGDIVHFYTTISGNGTIEITEETVVSLHGRCPLLSEKDRLELQQLVDEGTLLGDVDHDAKALVFSEAAKYPRTIPSFRTFFQDQIYLGVCSNVLRTELLDERPVNVSLRQAFAKIYQYKQEAIVQRNVTDFETISCLDQEDAFALSYCQLWLAAMRLWPYLSTRKPRIDSRNTQPPKLDCDGDPYRTEIARSAQRLGFDSTRILDKAQGHSPRARVGPSYDGYVSNGSHDTKYRLAERCGIPLNSTTITDLNSLYLPKLFEQEFVPGKDLTPLFVRRVFFERIFPDSERLYRAFSTQRQSNASSNQPTRESEPQLQKIAQPLTASRPSRISRPQPKRNRDVGQPSSSTRGFLLTTYESDNRVLHEGWVSASRISALKEHDYRLMTNDMRHIDLTSLPDFVGQTILGVGPELDMNMVRRIRGYDVILSDIEEMDL